MFIDVHRVPPDGVDLEEDLSPDRLPLEGEFRWVGPVHVSVRVTPMEEGTFSVRGTLKASIDATCVRCLESFTMGMLEQLDLMCLPQSANVGKSGVENEELELTDRDLAVSFYHDDTIDLGRAFWEQVCLALPMKPLCKEDCRGLCQQCGTNLNLSTCSCPQESLDPRLAALKSLLKS